VSPTVAKSASEAGPFALSHRPVTVVWRVHSTPSGTSSSIAGDKDSSDRTRSEIPYLRNVATSEFYTKVREAIEREMPLDTEKIVECNFQKAGGYELAVEVVIKPGEEFLSDREYRDWTRFPARPCRCHCAA
jgi:hypothetical protein